MMTLFFFNCLTKKDITPGPFAIAGVGRKGPVSGGSTPSHKPLLRLQFSATLHQLE